jgi:hypothetical protein
VQERIPHAVEDRSVELRLSAFDDQLDVLVLRGCEIAHQAEEPLAGVMER